MSFSSKIKDEISRQRFKSQAEKLAFLSAATSAAGSLTISGARGIGIKYVTENHGFAKLIAQVATSMFRVASEISVNTHERLKARNIVVRLSGGGCQELLEKTGCSAHTEDSAERLKSIAEEDTALRSFLKGAFLGCGSVVDPQKGYHLELVCKDEIFASMLLGLLNGYLLNARTTVRKSTHVVYIKESERIAEFLTLIGAMAGRMEFEHARILRGVNNNVNRQRNFEDANMQKAARAAAQQRLDIELISREMGLDRLPKKLREAAELRLNNPEATLAELSTALGIGKSGTNHRLAKLAEIAGQLRLERGQKA